MPAPLDIAHAWIAAWNSRDLERVLTLYDDEAEMSSPHIVRRGLDANGCLKGKARLRGYWSEGLKDLPNLHFDLLDVYAAPDSIVVRYRNERGGIICEYLRLNAEGRIAQGSANHLIQA